MAKDRHIPRYSRLRKAELITAPCSLATSALGTLRELLRASTMTRRINDLAPFWTALFKLLTWPFRWLLRKLLYLRS